MPILLRKIHCGYRAVQGRVTVAKWFPKITTTVTLRGIVDGKITKARNIRLTLDSARGCFRRVKHAGRMHEVTRVDSVCTMPKMPKVKAR